ncbi:4-hydroxy-tetrahydrodipicolinate synthase [Kribbella sandramycini]|uniref:4-hydroxy-tetrahydrodipicolinate synthase n=1 Tax=Kribbella sandramycini TaxID=60450 RepID=A0A7Y4NYA6_9ACTN|nr:4-hydroxy-tetrahydrodipicolinate synthase [Kribbella sandramycini]MBB6568665.1 4-hydroxy-tetrahydrodipicolinate synthase [Kribbella sandramycini]NOL38749.1 4-hydroxy-tetrahydrodipicolinate synthase [Kribbella sandramycini]
MSSPLPFGRLTTAMVTPFRPDGALDLAAAQKVAAHLVDGGNDALILNGTTGEAPTTSDQEKTDVIRAVREAVGDRAKLVAGVGTNDTAHTIELARQAEAAGADGLLVVTPYYNKPPQEGLRAHFTQVADATGLPNLLYDIPGRAGVEIRSETLIALAEHPRIVAVKDAKGDLAATTKVLANTDLFYYCGADELNLASLAIGAVGIASVVAHVASPQYRQLIDAAVAGDLATAQEIDRRLVPAVEAIMTITQGAIMVKAALQLAGVLDHATLRSPLVGATPAQVDRLTTDLKQAGLIA